VWVTSAISRLTNRLPIPLPNAFTTGSGPFIGRARRLITSAGIDPIVRYAIGDVSLRIPLSHQLPRIRRRYPTYGTNQAAVATSLLQKYPDLSAIDIGANIGDTVALWREVGDFPVLAVEPSERYLRLLRLNSAALGDLTIHGGLIGEADAEAQVKIEERLGTARLVAGDQLHRITRLTSLIEAYPRFRDAKLVKIDTDGSDGEVILGGYEWIATAKPAVFFEFSPSLASRDRRPLLDAVAMLVSLGYGCLMFYDNVGEFALSVRASESERIEELHAHALAWGEERYWDVAAFHGEDEDVAAKLRAHELRRS
jgi:FkbM family methyltransferase